MLQTSVASVYGVCPGAGMLTRSAVEIFRDGCGFLVEFQYFWGFFPDIFLGSAFCLCGRLAERCGLSEIMA